MWRMASMVILAASLAAAVEAGETAPGDAPDRITLESKTNAGDVTLKPGVYRVEHQSQGTLHLLHFTPVTNPREEWTVIVKCDRDPSRPPWKRTELTFKKEGGTPRITRIVLKGERVAYLLD